jgi:hypothetical protein
LDERKDAGEMNSYPKIGLGFHHLRLLITKQPS